MTVLKVGNVMFDEKAVVGLRWQEGDALKLALAGGVEYTLNGAAAKRVWERFESQSEDLMLETTSNFVVSMFGYS